MSVPQIRYTNLPSGAYRFRLQAQNAAGVWSPEVSSAEIVVAPPFWRSWWSYALYVLALSIGIMGSIRYHHRELERKHALQEREELTEARDAAEAANRAKSLFLANMSHEIRTPLNAILGYAQILQRHPELPVDVRGPIQTIESSGNHLLELINEVLDLSKIEAGRLERQDVDFDLRGLMESIGEMFRMRCEQKGLAWRLDSERLPEGPLHVHGDEQKIRQILINLLANAAKFTDGGEVMLRIAEATNQDSPNHEDDSAPPHYLFEVIDTGVGIAEEDRTRILTPFQQGSAARATEGTGLGLTIAHRMVHLLDGTIDFDSQAGKGSRFWFTLPLPPAEGEVVLPADIESAPVKRLAEGYTVKALVVDDVLENRDVLYQLLNDIGCEVQLAVNGLEALEAVRTERPDIVLMDIRMPVMDGLEAARRIIKEYGSGSIKLVAVTASAFAHNRQEYLNAGFDAFLSKPFKMVEIYNCIITLLGVEYVYDTGEDTPTGLAPVNMPDDMLSSLKEAAEYGDVTALDAAFDRLEVLGEDEHRLADHLRQLNENLEMGTILEILEEMTQYK
ncbi:MAG: response regulator [Candidatus Latescibacteria bacterium]|nr:response regulator [Candidatus Latescibacterota bacterium]